MASSKAVFISFAVIFTLWTFFLATDLLKAPLDNLNEIEALKASAAALERILKYENEQIEKLREKIGQFNKMDTNPSINQKDAKVRSRFWTEPIPVLVFACNRATAVRAHLDKLIELRPNADDFPIIVSQDCDDDSVRQAVSHYGEKVQYIKHLAGDKANITVPNNHRQYTAYYRISRHYKLALDYVFNTKKYTSVIITEDDLDVAADFFSYFSSTRYLLDRDPRLWCVSAWNDNGKKENIDINAPATLYRSDFFPGLGWMMSSTLWEELGQIWPAGFWDDWMRDPARRKGRQCIRPEVSRTGMTNFGKEGASKGQFFNKHLIRVLVNKQSVDFYKMNLDFLIEAEYNKTFHKEVYEDAELKDINEVAAFTIKKENAGKKIRVEYTGNVDYIRKADRLHIMHDFKAGVPRTAYAGVVTCFINDIRIYLVPDRTKVVGYDPEWSVPPSFGD